MSGPHASWPLPADRPAPCSHAQVLRNAGLRVTSARLIALRLLPSLLDAGSGLDGRVLHRAAAQRGHAISLITSQRVLAAFTAAGLLVANEEPGAGRFDGAASARPFPETDDA